MAELKVRGRQGVNIVAERLGVSRLAQLPDDRSLLGMLDPSLGVDSTAELFEHFRSREAVFYSSFKSRDEVTKILRTRFPAHAASVIEQAERICAGKFDLLGHRDLQIRGVLPDWHFDPISNTTSPKLHWSRIAELDSGQTGDKKVIWELNRHQYFSTLGQAYWLTNDEKYANAFFAHLEDWIVNNPPKIGVNWLSSLEIAFRSMSWIWGYHFFSSSPSLNEQGLTRILKHLYLFGLHLETYLSTYFSPNTHLTGEALGLYYLGCFFEDFEPGQRWKDIGYKILSDAVDFQIRPDGVYCEQSSHYHRYTTDFYLNLLVLRGLEGSTTEPKLLEKVNRLLDVMMHITQPDGSTQLFGDDDGGRLFFLDSVEVNDFRPTLALGAAVAGRPDLKLVAGGASPELLWLLGPEGLNEFDRIVAEEPVTTVKAFEEGGIYVARNSWQIDSDFVLINCGPHGFLNGGHAHADALNVMLSLGGRPIFVDSGTYSYSSVSDTRDRFRSTAAHNCLTVNGKGSSTPAGPFSWSSTAACRLIEWHDDGQCVSFHGEHDGFREIGVNYSRRVEYSRQGRITINDLISSKHENSFELNFILAPGLDAAVDRNSVKIFEGELRLASIETTVSKGHSFEWSIDDWEVSVRYGSTIPSKRLRLMTRGEGEISIVNSLKRL